MRKSKFYVAAIATLAFVMACDEEELEVLNPNQVVVESYYQTGEELEAGVNAIYGSIQSSNLVSREYWFLHDLRGDDNVSGGGQLEAPRNQILTGVHDPANFVMNSVWNGLYQVIHRANTVITEGPEAEEATQAEIDINVGQALAARGWAYFELGTIWGGVPVYLEYVETPDEVSPRSTQEEVLAQAIADLSAAAALLPMKAGDNYATGRLTAAAALAIKGRTEMYIGDYNAAKTSFDAIVNSGMYSLVAEYDDNFIEAGEHNEESIWEVGYADVGGYNWNSAGDGQGNEESVRTQEYSAIGWRNLIPSPALLNDFEREGNGDEKTDPRFAKSFYSIGDTYNNGESVLEESQVQGNTVLFEGEEQKISWRKYSLMITMDPGGFLTGPINMRMIRYAEVLLNLAEAELEVGSQARSVSLLNQVRARPSVDMPPYPTNRYPVGSPDEIMDAIIHEKRVELSSEQIRNRDILRWRREGKLDSEPLSYFTPNRHELMPIPQNEIDNNPNISNADQNPGY